MASGICLNEASNVEEYEAVPKLSSPVKRIATWSDELESLSKSGGKALVVKLRHFASLLLIL